MSILSIVATPIGNLEDISLRALRVLKEADYILCEDTRVSSKLLNFYNIKTKTISFHQHSKDLKVDKIIKLLESDNKIALITDAGTPGISDPGSKLVEIVRSVLKDKVKIEAIPGASALVSAVSISGTGFDHFLFLGFLPHKKGRQSKLKEIAALNYPVVLYESKHRILKLLKELKDIENEYNIKLEVSIARELTKMHESYLRGSAEELENNLNSNISSLKGEFVVLIKKIK